jgi:hypothetical protein
MSAVSAAFPKLVDNFGFFDWDNAFLSRELMIVI